jgi:hypothetical protein
MDFLTQVQYIQFLYFVFVNSNMEGKSGGASREQRIVRGGIRGLEVLNFFWLMSPVLFLSSIRKTNQTVENVFIGLFHNLKQK